MRCPSHADGLIRHLCGQTDPAPGLYPVRTPYLTVEAARLLLGPAHRCGAALVVTASSVDGAAQVAIPTHVLTAVGKDPRLGVRTFRQKNAATEIPQVWLIARRVRDLVVTRAHLLAADSIHAYALLAHECRLRCWLLFEQDPSEPQKTAIDAWNASPNLSGHDYLPIDAIDVILAHVELDTPTDTTTIALATGWAPRTDPYTFWATCEQTLTGDLLQHAASQVAIGILSMEEAYRDGPTTLATTLAGLWPLVDTAADSDVLVCRVRGAQIASLSRGIVINASHDGLVAAEPLYPVNRLDVTNVSLIDRLRLPEEAVAVLLDLLDVSTQEMEFLQVHDASPDGSTINIGGQALNVPEAAWHIVRALLERHRQWLSTDESPLLAGHGDGPIAANDLGSIIGLRGRLIGVPHYVRRSRFAIRRQARLKSFGIVTTGKVTCEQAF